MNLTGGSNRVTRHDRVTISQAGVSKSIVWIGGNSLLKVGYSVLQCRSVTSLPIVSPLQVQPVCFNIARGTLNRWRLADYKAALQFSYDSCCNLLLNVKDITLVAIITFRPH